MGSKLLCTEMSGALGAAAAGRASAASIVIGASPIPRLSAVSSPTSPSTTRPFASWKATTAASIFGPNLPSTSPGSKPFAFRARWMRSMTSGFMFCASMAKMRDGPGRSGAVVSSPSYDSSGSSIPASHCRPAILAALTPNALPIASMVPPCPSDTTICPNFPGTFGGKRSKMPPTVAAALATETPMPRVSMSRFQ